jgi:hypothetical protein
MNKGFRMRFMRERGGIPTEKPDFSIALLRPIG